MPTEVIVLSSDESDVFVTPHKPSLNTIKRRVRKFDDAFDDDEQYQLPPTRAIPSVASVASTGASSGTNARATSTSTNATSRATLHEDGIEIVDLDDGDVGIPFASKRARHSPAPRTARRHFPSRTVTSSSGHAGQDPWKPAPPVKRAAPRFSFDSDSDLDMDTPASTFPVQSPYKKPIPASTNSIDFAGSRDTSSRVLATFGSRGPKLKMLKMPGTPPGPRPSFDSQSPTTPRRIGFEDSDEDIVCLDRPPAVCPVQSTPGKIMREASLSGSLAVPKDSGKLACSRSDGVARSLFDASEDSDETRELMASYKGTSIPKPRTSAKQPHKGQAPKRALGRTGSSASASRAATDVDKEAEKQEKQEKQKEKEAERREREAKREERRLEKAAEKERRKIEAELAKEQRARDRMETATFNDANRSRTDKALASLEMIAMLSSGLPTATKEAAEGMLTEIKATPRTWTGPLLNNIVTWKRTVTSEYNADGHYWAPVDKRIEDEKHALVVFKGEEFVKLIVAGEDPGAKHAMGGLDLESHVRAMKRTFPQYSLIYLIEDLKGWKRKNRGILNRQFAAQVRSVGNPTPAAAAASAAALSRAQSQAADGASSAASRPSNRLGPRGQGRGARHVDESVVEDALLDLQMGFGDDDEDEHFVDASGTVRRARVMVHETKDALDTARWIKIFTEQVATARYRRLKEEIFAGSASFCMDSGQIQTGDCAATTYVYMLQQIGRVTDSVALGVAARHETLPKLLRGIHGDPLALATCQKVRNVNGAVSERNVGPALSRRIYRVFTEQDEMATNL